MTRSTPDPVFAEAGRAALLAEVRVEQARRERPRRPVLRLREVLIGSAVVAAAAAVLVVVHTAPLPRTEPATPASSTAVVPSTTPTPSATLVPPSLVPPSPTGSATLIGPTGSKERTESEIRAWAASVGVGSVMTDQDVLISRCMASKGYLYDPVRQYTGDLRAGHSGMSAADEAKWDLALHGTAQPGSYTWQTAGCDGLAVHETGQDGAN